MSRITYDALPLAVQRDLANLRVSMVQYMPDIRGAQITIEYLRDESPPTIDVKP
jgi:hypothetical protein